MCFVGKQSGFECATWMCRDATCPIRFAIARSSVCAGRISMYSARSSGRLPREHELVSAFTACSLVIVSRRLKKLVRPDAVLLCSLYPRQRELPRQYLSWTALVVAVCELPTAMWHGTPTHAPCRRLSEFGLGYRCIVCWFAGGQLTRAPQHVGRVSPAEAARASSAPTMRLIVLVSRIPSVRRASAIPPLRRAQRLVGAVEVVPVGDAGVAIEGAMCMA